MSLTFFLKLDDEIVKVSGFAQSESDLLQLTKDRYGAKASNIVGTDDVSFYVKDAQYSVFYEIEDFSLDMYEGAVVDVRRAALEIGEDAPIEVRIQNLRKQIENLEDSGDEPSSKRRKMNYVHNPEAFVLRLRGLPWGTTASGVAEWFAPISVNEDDVFLVLDWQNKPSGEAYVEFGSFEDGQAGKRKHKDNLGGRYIEVFDSTGTEMYRARCPPSPAPLPMKNSANQLLRMRGLPFGCTRAEVEQFFHGTPIESIHMTTNPRGLSNGEAFVELATEDDVTSAMKYDKEKIQSRYIELFRTNLSEANIPKFYIMDE